MTPLSIGLFTLACTFGGALLGGYIRELMPASHASKESQDVVRLGMGLVATMTALLLGLVTAAARETFSVNDGAMRTSAVNILTLDGHLVRYGADAKATRDLLRQAVSERLRSIWPEDGSAGRLEGGEARPPIEQIESQILALTPNTDEQRYAKTEALKLVAEVVKMRWRILGQSSGIPRVFLAVLIFWLTMTFASFGLYAPRNVTVTGALFIAAISVAAAVFLIVELDGPFEGVIKVSSEPLRFAFEQLGAISTSTWAPER